MILEDSVVSEAVLKRNLYRIRRCRVCIGKRCSRFNVFDSRTGNVIVCPLHPNPHGILMRRRKKVSHVLRRSK